MRNAPAFVVAALVALIFFDMPGSGYFLAGDVAYLPSLAVRADGRLALTAAAAYFALRAWRGAALVTVARVDDANAGVNVGR
jgi:hypothetical protein